LVLLVHATQEDENGKKVKILYCTRSCKLIKTRIIL